MGLSETIHIQKQEGDKKLFLDLLLLGDEQEDMIDRYLNRGELYVMYGANSAVLGVAVMTDEGNGICELKNIAIAPSHQRKGYGREMISFLLREYKKSHQTIRVGTGDSVQTTAFYQSCGFRYAFTLPDFFTNNYNHPIIEEGKVLKDMIYFQKDLV